MGIFKTVERIRECYFGPNMAKVFNKTMNAYLRKTICQASESTVDWQQYIGPLMFSHNTAVHKAMLCTPFYSMFSYDPRMPLWQGGYIFPEDGDFIDDRVDPQIHLWKKGRSSTPPPTTTTSTTGSSIWTRPKNTGWPQVQCTSPARRCGARYTRGQGKTPSCNPCGRRVRLSATDLTPIPTRCARWGGPTKGEPPLMLMISSHARRLPTTHLFHYHEPPGSP
jgi:hypothetical protein